jgi:carbamoyl-phosphate synthase large subunit
MKMLNILFTGGGGSGNEALWRLLGESYILHFGDADKLSIDPGIPEDRRHQLPWAADHDFVSKISGLCQRLDIDVLIPGVDEELLVLARNEKLLAPTLLLLPHADYVKTMLDKLHMITALSQNKIPVPQSMTLADDFKRFHFPCISKPRSGRGSRGVKILNSIQEAVALKAAAGDSAERILLQEYLEGIEYTVQMIADSKGQLCAIVPVKVGIKRGITIRAETESEPRVIAACQEIHQVIPTRGCYNIQLILTAEGKVFPFEINPRVSTTLCLVVASGVDPVSQFIQGKESKRPPSFQAGLQLQRHWTNHFIKGAAN